MAGPGQALTILPTFESSFTGFSSSDTTFYEADVNNAIRAIENYIANPVTVKINFVGQTKGLGDHARRVPGVTTMKSFSGGMQIYYHCGQPAWKKHHPFQYIVKASRSGRYEIQAKVVSVKPTEYLNLLVNHSSAPVTITIPWTNGMWQQTKPVEITLIRGDNTLTFDRGKDTGFPAKGIFALSIKNFVLTPRSMNQ